jgi:hypothetical protein
MRQWMALCDYIIAAEFPDCDLVHAFWVFNVRGSRAKAGHGYFHDDPTMIAACAEQRTGAFRRLATAFKVDEAGLTEQFNKCLPVARHQATTRGSSNGEAWQFAAQNVGRHTALSSLLPVLHRYFGFGMSTTGVEHTFATARDVLEHRGSAKPDKVVQLLVLSREFPQQESEVYEIVGEAMELWARFRGAARTGGAHFDRGVARPCQSGPSSGAGGTTGERSVSGGRSGKDSLSREAWLRARRRAVASEVHDQDPGRHLQSDIRPVDDEGALPPELQQEVKFQREKRSKRKFEALELDYLCKEEITDEVQGSAQKFPKGRAKLHKQAENKRARDQKKREPERLTLEELNGHKVYVKQSDAAAVIDRVHALGAETVSDVTDCTVLVVERLDPASLGRKTLWAAMLLGTYIVMPEFLHGKPSAILKYQAAIGFWRSTFITQKIQEKRKAMVELLLAVCARPESKWQILPSEAALARAWEAARRTGKAGQVVILARNGERRASGPKVMYLDEFQASIDKADATRTLSSSEVTRGG